MGKEDTPAMDQYKATLNDLRSWLGPVHVFFSGGEALLRPYTPELLAHAASIGLFPEILTHGRRSPHPHSRARELFEQPLAPWKL